MAKYNLQQYLVTQSQETYRACVIHAPAMGNKTATARRVRDRLDAYLLDLQAYFLERPDLAAGIDCFRPADLEALLRALDVPQALVVVDNLDFLLNTWTRGQVDEFLSMVESRFKSPGDTDKTFVFFLQPHPDVVGHALHNTRGQPRILPLDAFYAP